MGVAIMKRYRSVICFPCGTCTQDISIYRIDIPFIYPSMKPAHDCPCPFSRIWSWKTLRFRMRKKSICTWSILRPWSNSVSSIWLSSFAAIISAFSLRWVPCSSCYIYIYFSICFIYSCYMYKNAHPVIWYFFFGGVFNLCPHAARSHHAPRDPSDVGQGASNEGQGDLSSLAEKWGINTPHGTSVAGVLSSPLLNLRSYSYIFIYRFIECWNWHVMTRSSGLFCIYIYI